MQNRVPFVLSLIAGVIFIFQSWTGSIGMLQYIAVIPDVVPELAQYEWLFTLLLYVLTAIAGLGGVGVIAGGVLLTRGRVGTGKFVIGLAAGMSLIGVLVNLGTNIWLGGAVGALDILMLGGSLAAFVAIVLSIVARRMAGTGGTAEE